MKKSTVQILSFLSGMTMAAVVIGVTISKSPSLRGEIESQINTVLKTTRTVVNAYKSVATKSVMALNLMRTHSPDTNSNGKDASLQQSSQVTSQWDAVEKDLLS